MKSIMQHMQDTLRDRASFAIVGNWFGLEPQVNAAEQMLRGLDDPLAAAIFKRLAPLALSCDSQGG